ncbi:MAG: serine hydrolase domain-containing protein [Gammaproteobacteria bacterium]|nr:serine hydrolase domain-containing protein [Gammaproteobacteria bacterium]
MNIRPKRSRSPLSLCLILLLMQGCRSVDSQMGDAVSNLLPQAEMSLVRREASKLIQGMLDEELVPGVSIALVNSAGLLWVEGFGEADRQKAIPATADTIYRVGSLSKPLTALGVMQVSAEGGILLDGSLQGQLAGFSVRSHHREAFEITPRQLLSHRSGLPSDLRKGMYTDTPFTQITRLLQDEYIAFLPDTVYSYSNLGYDLLGHLIEQATEQTFASYMQSQLFAPLGMTRTGFDLTGPMRRYLAAGHLDGQVRPQPPLRDTPALGLYSSARDLGRLSVALLQGGVPGLREGQLIEMWTPQMAKGQLTLGVYPGLGWFIEDDAVLGRVVRHGGSTLLFGAELALLPDQELGVVVLANGADGHRIARSLAATLLQLSVELQGSKQILQAIRTPKISEDDQLIPSGSYATDLGLLMVDPDHPRLCACIIERILDMVRFDDGSFGLTPESAASLPSAYRVLGELRFSSRHRGGRDVLLAVQDGTEMLLGSRIEAHPWTRVWQQHIGNYKTLNPDGDYAISDLQISNEEGVFCLHYRAPHLSDSRIRVPLKPVSATEAVIEGLGRGRGETVRIVEINGKQCLRFSGYLGEPVTTD